MQDKRVKIAVLVLAIAIALGSGFALYGARHTPAPIVITGAPATSPPAGDTAPPSPTVSPAAVAANPPAAAVPDAGISAPSSPESDGSTPGLPATDSSASQSATTQPGTTTPGAPASPSEIAVDVVGGVKKPGVCFLRPGSRIVDAVHAVGGPTRNADVQAINLAEPVTDGEKIYVPRKGELPDQEGAGNLIGSDGPEGTTEASVPTTPSLRRRGPLRTEWSPPSGNGSVAPAGIALPEGGVGASDLMALPAVSGRRSRRSGAASGSPEKLTDPSEGTIDLNAASEADLERLPGVGPGMAQRILDFRQQNGAFHSIDDLRQVGGIGEKRFARIAPFVRV